MLSGAATLKNVSGSQCAVIRIRVNQPLMSISADRAGQSIVEVRPRERKGREVDEGGMKDTKRRGGSTGMTDEDDIDEDDLIIDTDDDIDEDEEEDDL